MYQRFTPAAVPELPGHHHSSSETYTQNANLKVTNTDLFALPAGHVGVAGLLQVATSAGSLPVNPLLARATSGVSPGRPVAASATITRVRWSSACRVFSMLTADVSDVTTVTRMWRRTASKPTYKVGLEFRPIKTLLLRANYGDRVPHAGLGYVFIGPSGFFSSVTDYYRASCFTRRRRSTMHDDPNAQSRAADQGQRPNRLQVDHLEVLGIWRRLVTDLEYRPQGRLLRIQISNEVQYQASTRCCRRRACRLGQSGINSPTCLAAEAAIQRGPANGPSALQLIGITVSPINVRGSGSAASSRRRTFVAMPAVMAN